MENCWWKDLLFLLLPSLMPTLVCFLCVFHRSSRQNEGMTKKREREREKGFVKMKQADLFMTFRSPLFSYFTFTLSSSFCWFLQLALLIGRKIVRKIHSRLSAFLSSFASSLWNYTHIYTYIHRRSRICEEWIMKNNDDGRRERKTTFRNRHTHSVMHASTVFVLAKLFFTLIPEDIRCRDERGETDLLQE